MTDKTAVMIVDNSFSFGGAINSLSSLAAALDRSFLSIVVTAQSKEFVEGSFPHSRCYRFTPKLPWVNNRIYKFLVRLPVFKIAFLSRGLKLARCIFWLLFIIVPEAFRYFRWGRANDVRLVHLNNIMDSQVAGIIASKALGVPCIAHLRDFLAVTPANRFFARVIDHHIAISTAIRSNLLELGVPPHRISLVHDGLDLERFSSSADCSYLFDEFGVSRDHPRYGIFGRVIEWKGIEEFLRAAQLVAELLPDARGFIVGSASDGDPAFYHRMRTLACELGLQDKVIFTGYRNDVPQMMSFMDVVVHASNRPEPFGMVIIEAMALCKPVVATRAGGPVDIISDAENGYLVDMGDVAGLGGAVARLLQDPPLCRRMGRIGRSKVERTFGARRYAEQIGELYRRYTCNTAV